MSLFPAYAQDNVESGVEYRGTELSLSPRCEAALLASDDESPPHCEVPPPPPPPSCDCYLDRDSEAAYTRYSTLYYPARPHYPECEKRVALGAGGGRVWRRRKRARRYFEAAALAAPLAAPLAEQLAERRAAYRRLLADAPHDVQLWIQFINFLEGAEAARAALEAARAAPGSRALRELHRRLARLHLPADQYLTMLRDHIAAEKRPEVLCELWVCLVRGAAGGAAGAGGVEGVAALAVQRAPIHAYPRLLMEYGLYLRAAGLWETLVLLLELVVTMTFPGGGLRAGAGEAAAGEDALGRAEGAARASGLPLAARWARVEGTRAHHRWRPALHHDDDVEADPQRRPLAGDVAGLLRPLPAPLHAPLLHRLLLLAKVPLLPSAGWSVRALALPPAEAATSALLPLLRASRRLPPAHPSHATPRAPAAALALLEDPPHYGTTDNGYWEWVNSLWDASIGWVTGRERLALLCWRLRWLHALILVESDRKQAGRMRGEARGLLRAHARGVGGPLPFLHFARIEALVNGAAAGRSAALLATRSLLRAGGAGGAEEGLWAARVLAELGAAPAAAWTVVAAALPHVRAQLPDISSCEVSPPPAELVSVALSRCEERCQQLEDAWCRAGAAPEEPYEESAVFLPGAGEWAAARVSLAPPKRLQQIYSQACATAPHPDISIAEARYLETQACALAAARTPHAARWACTLADLFPDNPYLAMASGGAPLWAQTRGRGRAAPLSECRWLGRVLPPLLGALGEGGEGEGGAGLRRAARAAGRAARGAGAGALLHAAALELAARAPSAGGAPDAALYAALDAHPNHKWLYVRGARLTGSGAALADVILERGLRLHALPLELELELDPLP